MMMFSRFCGVSVVFRVCLLVEDECYDTVPGCMAERLKHQLLEKEQAVDIVAGPDSYKDLPRLLALTDNNQTAVNVLLSLDETYADIVPVRLNQDSVTAFVYVN
jgi:tRNA A37 methylthiotransferase MiaB